jgi:hypothetical protein
MHRPVAMSCAALLLFVPPLTAQRLAPEFASSPPPAWYHATRVRLVVFAPADTNRDAIRLVMGGLGLGVVGVFVGGYAGAKLEQNSGCGYDDYCGLAGALLGATVGETILMPAGVHLANGERGSYLLAVGAAGLVATSAWVIALGSNDAAPLLAIPVGQLITAAVIELHTGARPRAP